MTQGDTMCPGFPSLSQLEGLREGCNNLVSSFWRRSKQIAATRMAKQSVIGPASLCPDLLEFH
jgi:hypothetical protein